MACAVDVGMGTVGEEAGAVGVGTGAVGVGTGAVGVVEGDGEARGRGSAEEQPEEIRDRTTKRQIIHRLLNIVDPFNGFDHKLNYGEYITSA